MIPTLIALATAKACQDISFTDASFPTHETLRAYTQKSRIPAPIDSAKALAQKFTLIERSIDIIDGKRTTTSVQDLLTKERTKAVLLVAVGNGCPHADHNQRFIDGAASVLHDQGIEVIALYNSTETTTKKFFDRYQSPLAVIADPTCRTQFTSGLPISNSFVAFTKQGPITLSDASVSEPERLAKGSYPFTEKALAGVLVELLGKDTADKTLGAITKRGRGPTDFGLGCPLVPETR
jgi:hypothetical protein